jgi:mono/diheme cytochrome c family protein
MRNVVAVVTVGAMLAGCLVAEPEEKNAAPVLASVGEQFAVADTGMTIALSASDADGDALTYTSDGTVGPYSNPYLAATPAVFSISNARFTWTPGAAQAGKYSVRFTVTDNASSPASDSETVTINVYATAAEAGAVLFAGYCQGCHGANAVGIGSVPNIQGRTATDVSNALQTVTQMKSVLGATPPANYVTWLGAYLESLP